MRITGNILLYLLIGSIHWWWTTNLSVFGTAPNMIFAAALSSAIISRPVKAIAFCFFFGIFLDLLGANLFGAYALIYTLMAYGVYLLKRHIDLAGSFPQVAAAMILTVVTMLLYQALSLSLAKVGPLQLKAFLVEPFLNALIAPIVFSFFSQLKKRFDLL